MVEQTRYDEATIDPRLMPELWEHRGQWAAIKDDRVIAYGSTPRQALRRAIRKGVTDPLLHRIPADGDNTYVL